MADETSIAAGKRFSRDLRRIREDRGVSIDDLHNETRIARSLIESFEEGGLYNHETFNEVYLRSFVRAYADALEISPDTVRAALDKALDGSYENGLAEKYLPSPSSGQKSRPADDEGGETDRENRLSSTSDSSAKQEDSKGGSPEPPSAGGPEGRGGIVGPARELGEGADEGEGPIEDSSDSMSQKAPDAEFGLGEDADQGTSSDTSEDRDDLSSPSEEGGDSSSGLESSPEESTDESDEMSADRRPSWMEEAEEDTETSAPPDPDSLDSRASSRSEEASSPSPGAVGESGIVGEPTAMGSDSEAAPAAGRSSPSSSRAPARNRSASGSRHWFTGDRREFAWAGIGVLVVLLVLVGLGIAFFSSGSDSASQPSTAASTAPAPDTAASSATDTSAVDSSAGVVSRPPLANVTLGETISLTVLATRDVRGIRIQRDEDLSRPYWIEDGEAAVFPFRNRVILRDELSDIQLFLAGYPYPESDWDSTGPVVITRSQVEAFVDTLRGGPAALRTTVDTIPKGPPNQ